MPKKEKAEVKKVEKLSEKYLAFKELVETYKSQNPEKYAQKKARLEEKLSSLK